MGKKTGISAILGGGLLIIVLALVILAISGLFWGWPIIVIAGICGWNIPLIPVGWALGVGLSLLIGAVSGS